MDFQMRHVSQKLGGNQNSTIQSVSTIYCLSQPISYTFTSFEDTYETQDRLNMKCSHVLPWGGLVLLSRDSPKKISNIPIYMHHVADKKVPCKTPHNHILINLTFIIFQHTTRANPYEMQVHDTNESKIEIYSYMQWLNNNKMIPTT